MPTAAKSDEGEVLAGVGCVALEVVERAEEGDEDDGGDEDVEEDREGVDLDGSREGAGGAEAELEPAGDAGGDGGEDREPAEGLAGGAGLEDGLGEHDEDAGEGEDEFGEEGEEIGGHVSSGLPDWSLELFCRVRRT